MYGPYTNGVDPALATYVSGSWIEDDAESEWSLTENGGAPLTFGTAVGTLPVFPPVRGRPKVSYTAADISSNCSPSTTACPPEGATSIGWTANNRAKPSVSSFRRLPARTHGTSPGANNNKFQGPLSVQGREWARVRPSATRPLLAPNSRTIRRRRPRFVALRPPRKP